MNDRGATDFEPSDAHEAQLGFGQGGVPWYLMVFYLAFLAFFAWYTLEYQLPDYLEEGPVAPAEASETPR